MDLGAAMPALLLTIVLLALNGFFVAAEFAIVRVRGTQLDELAEHSQRARLGRHISEHIDGYLSACQVGITGASLALGIVGEPAVAALIEPLFGWLLRFSEAAFHALSFAIAFAVITYLHLVVGEQAPKYLAIQRPVPTTLWTAHPLYWFALAFRPFVWLVNTSANFVLRPFGVRPGDELESHSAEELRMLVAIATRRGVLEKSEEEIVANALVFADTYVRQAMIPRTEIVAVPDDATLDDLRELARQHRYSRFPVYHEDLDHVVGVIHVRDLITPAGGASVMDLMRKVPAIPETMRLDQVLAEFKRQRAQAAIVIDEFGGTAGLITFEDILEELIGEVHDEFDRSAPSFAEEGKGVYVIDGLASLDDVRERLKLDLPDDGAVTTIGGMIFARLGRLATVGDTVEVDGYRFQVTAVDGRRIAQVRAQPLPNR